MESSKDTLQNVLKKAQLKGYAEPVNPELDLNGADAFSKVEFCLHFHLIQKFLNINV